MPVIDPASVQKTALRLLLEHDLGDWRFEFSITERSVGRCRHRDKTIEFSTHYLSSPAHVIYNTLLHEVSHAIVGPGHGHDKTWQKVARQLGCSGTRCETEAVSTLDMRYTIECIRCGNKWRRNRLVKWVGVNCQCGGNLRITDHHNDPA